VYLNAVVVTVNTIVSIATAALSEDLTGNPCKYAQNKNPFF
jgi:hypothetical protein